MSKRTLVIIATLFLFFLLASCGSPEEETAVLVPSGEYEKVDIWYFKEEKARITIPDSDYLVGDFVRSITPGDLDADHEAVRELLCATVREMLKDAYVAQYTRDCRGASRSPEYYFECKRMPYVITIPPTEWLEENMILEQYSSYVLYIHAPTNGDWALLYSEDECQNTQNIVIDDKAYCLSGSFHSRFVANAFLEECETLDCFQEILKRGLAFRFSHEQRYLFIVFPDDMSELTVEDLEEDGYWSTLEVQIWEFSSD